MGKLIFVSYELNVLYSSNIALYVAIGFDSDFEYNSSQNH